MSVQFCVRQIYPLVYEVATFEHSSTPTHVCKVTTNNKMQLSCNCLGYHRQKDKTQHKHCRLVKFYIENLEKLDGYIFWFEDNDESIEYTKLFDLEFLEKKLEELGL